MNVTDRCKHCGTELQQPAVGRKKVYCDQRCKDNFHNAIKNPINNAKNNAKRTSTTRAKSEIKTNQLVSQLSANLLAEFKSYDEYKRRKFLREIVAAVAFNTIDILGDGIYKKSHVQKALTFTSSMSRGTGTSKKETFADIINSFCVECYGFTISQLYKAANKTNDLEKIYEYQQIIGENFMLRRTNHNNWKYKELVFDADDEPDTGGNGFLYSLAMDICKYPPDHELHDMSDRLLKKHFNFDFAASGMTDYLDIILHIEEQEKAQKS